MSESDGYQPHLIAPEQGYRRLIEGALNYFRGPAEASVDAVSGFLAHDLSFFFFTYMQLIVNHFLGAFCLERTCQEVDWRN